MLIGGILHATAMVVLAFFVWFAAARSTGLLKLLGTLLGWWLVLLAAASLLFAATGMGGRHMGVWGMHGGEEPAAAANNTAT
jgi:hypothetical protein